ncbi:MAG TPA: hypothetical protein PKD64_12660 [Pirellulaceae bacterium]|nr:hypothetical protein [Pirellulaceae bacterium]HMO93039.1 hypothetical protein [Pirellulaceae bacterium]HMP69669.1 hypothetical protein [Pirellulaceae bacterium]
MRRTCVRTNLILITISFFVGFVLASRLDAQQYDIELSKQATEILRDYCKLCHGDDFNFPLLDVMSRESLLAPNGKNKKPFVVPGKPDESRIWSRIKADEMPPDYMPQLSEDQKSIVQRWIADGAYFPPISAEERTVRPFFGQETTLQMISEDLNNIDQEDYPYIRYFSLMHLWNNVEGPDPITDEDLRMVRAAVSKMINSLSTRPRIVPPRVVEAEYGTLLAIDLRDYGWTSWHWNQLLTEYPYGLRIGGRDANRVYNYLGTRVPYLRADWFVFHASRPPLYHTLLNIPMNAKTLEEHLGVNIYENFTKNTLMRAAFDGKSSGVSKQNRLVERHEPTRGTRFYWKSYDMLPEVASTAAGDFTRSPLGPIFEEYAGRRQLAAFEHDGGEIIYSLPNGLQAYMLVDGKDRRIDAGPLSVVQDPNQHSNTPEIVNGISCMGCHDQGMITWKADQIRPIYLPQQGSAVADKVLKLFPENDVFQRIVDEDRQYFMENLKKATGDFLMAGQRKRDAQAMTKFYTGLLQATDTKYDAAKLEGFVDEEMARPNMETMERKQLVMNMIAKGNDKFEWGLSIDDAVAMYEINPIKHETSFNSFADPVTKISKIYYRDVTIHDIARELGLPDRQEDADRLNMKTAAHLKLMCSMPQFQNLGLATLSQNGGTINRATWERAYGRVAREMGCGVPVDIQQ